MPTVYRNAICLPCLGAENRPLVAGYAAGGVFSNEKLPIKDAFLFRRYRRGAKIINGRWETSTSSEVAEYQMILAGEVGETQKRLKGKHIFAGYLFPHFGHFLLESLSRLWYIRDFPDMPLVWHGVHNQADFTGMHKAFFELLGIQNPMHIVTEQTEVEELVVPEPGYVINNLFSDAQAKALSLPIADEPKPGKKVWLSRSKLETARVLNETQLERILEDDGWHIYHPQDHSIPDQITMLADAEVIAGVEGSAFHTLILLPALKSRVIIFGRGLKFNLDYAVIGQKHGHDLMLISPPRIRWDSGLPQWESNWIWPDLDFVLKALNVKRAPKAATPLPKPLVTITKSVADFFKRQMAVELWPESNALAADLPVKVMSVVSDRFAFDVSTLKRQGLTCYEFTADQFFTILSQRTRHDMFCFRHHPDYQTLLRAFNGSLACAADDAIWVIDGQDSSTSANDSANERLVATIRDQYPPLSLARVQGSAVTIVWRQGRHGFTPAPEGTDQTADGFIADIPVLHINDIAKAAMDAKAMKKEE